MSEPLPQALADLQPIHPPAAISWWPPAPGWWVLLGLTTLLLYVGWRHYRAARPQRAALKALRNIERSQSSSVARLAALNQLLKRYLLSCKQTQAASLSGEAWLQFLDRHCKQHGFLDAAGALLLTTPYLDNPDETDPQTVITLFKLSRHWIRQNRPRKLELHKLELRK